MLLICHRSSESSFVNMTAGAAVDVSISFFYFRIDVCHFRGYICVGFHFRRAIGLELMRGNPCCLHELVS
jgi:hypothetical protein